MTVNYSDVIILGGGISGLATALACITKGYNVTILEKANRLGGRIDTIQEGPLQYEAGAGRIHADHHRAMMLLRMFHMTMIEIPPLREFRDVHHSHLLPIGDPSARFIRKILRTTRHVKREDVMMKTFRMICHEIIGPIATEQLEAAFGYNAEFEKMNAWDALEMFRNDFSYSTGDANPYYTCVEGFGTWIARIEDYLVQSGRVNIYKQHRVTGWRHLTRGDFRVYTQRFDQQSIHFTGSAIVCALPKDDLLSSFRWTPYQRSLLDSVESVPLHRIYGRFPAPNGKPWFHNIPTTTTDNPIRQFIPIRPEKGLVMMSYSDSHHATHWNQYAQMGDKELRKALLSNLHVVFPHIPNVPTPSWIHSHYWDAGVHMWKPGVNSNSVADAIRQIYGPEVPWYLVGESYSLHQAWIEGALETVDAILPALFDHLAKKGGAKHPTIIDLHKFKQNFPKMQWVILKDPRDHKKKLLDITEWSKMHPGGASPFMDRLYEDITPWFQSIPSHKDHGKWKQTVMDAIDRYTYAYVN